MKLLDTMQRGFIEYVQWIDYEVVDNSDGKWPVLVWYNKELNQPTQEELRSAWVEVEKKLKLEELKKQKSEEINSIATLSDQLNLLADVCYILTEWNTEPKILEARKILENIRVVINK